jgi:DNA-binding MarR family transcriptional regulator
VHGARDEPIGALLRRVFTRITAAAAGDATASRDAVVLDVLATHDGSSQQELAERLGINRTIMVKLVDRLEAAGWVTRERRPDDRRSYALTLTPGGRSALTRLREELSDRDAQITAALSAAEQARLRELLGRLLPQPGTPVTSTEFLVAQAHQRLRRVADGLLADVGLRMPHYGPLLALEVHGPLPQRDVARGLSITEPATAELVDELVAAGLVVRGRDPHDRRRYALELTPTGRERLGRIREAQAQVQAHVAGLVGGAGEVDELRELQQRLLAEPAEPEIT